MLPAPTASPSPGPVRIDRCHVSYIGATHGIAVSEIVGPVHVTFTNTGTRVISAITIAIDLGGKEVTVRDTGTFSPRVPIEALFDPFRGAHVTMSNEPQPTCTARDVEFAQRTLR